MSRVAVVTGGDSGIGAACANALAHDGCDVAVLYHSDEESARGVVAAIEARCDVPLIAADWDGADGRIALSASLLRDGPAVRLSFSRDDATLHRATVEVSGRR